MIELHPEVGQTVESFADDMCWIAKRTYSYVFGYFNEIMLIALPEDTPQEVAGLYWRKIKGHTNVNAE